MRPVLRSVSAVVLAAVVLGGAAAAAPHLWESGAQQLPAAASGSGPDEFAPAAAALPRLGRTTTYRVGSSVDPTGRQDVTSALLAFLRGVPDGAVVMFPARSRYRVEGVLELAGRSRLVLDGNGSEFFATAPGDPNRALWRLVGGTDLVLRRMGVRGTNPDGGTPDAFDEDRQWQHGVDIRGSRRVLVDRVAISDVHGDCVYVGSAPNGTWSEDVRVQSSQCVRNGRQGMAVTAGRRVLLQGSRLAEISLLTVDLEPNGPSGGATDVLVRENRIGGEGRQQFFGIGGVGLVSRVRVERNVLIGKALTVLVVTPKGQARTGIAVLSNRSDTADERPNGAAMVFQSVRGLRVEGNLAPLSGGNMALVMLTCTTGATVAGNTYPGGVAQVRSAGSRCG